MDPYASPSKFSPKIIMAIAGGVLLLIILFYIIVSQSISNKNNEVAVTPTGTATNDSNILPTRSTKMDQQKASLPQDVVAKVGNEYLYKEELDLAVANYGLIDGDQKKTEEVLLNNMVNQSVALQAGEKMGLISLNNTVFNAKGKDMQKRYQLYEEVKIQILNKASSIEGSYVSLLFNNDSPGPIGLEEGKKKSLETIQSLHQQVVAGNLTIQQAGEQIKANPDNANIDPLFKLHAYQEFKQEAGKQITIDPTFDELLKKLNNNQYTDVHLLKVLDKTKATPTFIETGYVFGHVTNKVTSGFSSFEEWISTQRKNYEIIY